MVLPPPNWKVSVKHLPDSILEKILTFFVEPGKDAASVLVVNKRWSATLGKLKKLEEIRTLALAAEAHTKATLIKEIKKEAEEEKQKTQAEQMWL
eukprot:TRINITY_DN30046_c0_g2_i1.p1 TRINITY_DN30046_c0_g2~~TRINITY_DN30046_c0_g2_i1.p1  ORF type:complete len:105 (-),score=16.35 TRINITY_DN30046_c0_g2_i1:60-344(-)